MQELLKEMEMQQKKDKEEAQYSDNNFWRIKSADQTDKEIDDLFRELEDDSETTPASEIQKTEETKEADKEASKESESSENWNEEEAALFLWTSLRGQAGLLSDWLQRPRSRCILQTNHFIYNW